MAESPTEPLVVRLVRKVAPELGIEVDISAELGFFGRLTHQGKLIGYMKGSSFDLNPRTASDLVNSKVASAYFLEKSGHPVINGSWFSLTSIRSEEGIQACANDAFEYAQKLGFPVYIKPNALSQGIGVSKVYGPEDFYLGARYILERDTDLLVQEVATGGDYRIIVLDGEVICAYLRTPLSITGNGRATILQLLEQRHQEVVVRGAAVKSDDSRILSNLQRNGLHLDSVLEEGKVLQLLDNANLSSGGQATDVSHTIHPRFKEAAITLVRDMGLRFCGVDLMIDPNSTQDSAQFKVVELNAAPGLDNYAGLGSEQLRVAEDLYGQILRKMIEVSYTK